MKKYLLTRRRLSVFDSLTRLLLIHEWSDEIFIDFSARLRVVGAAHVNLSVIRVEEARNYRLFALGKWKYSWTLGSTQIRFALSALSSDTMFRLAWDGMLYNLFSLKVEPAKPSTRKCSETATAYLSLSHEWNL